MDIVCGVYCIINLINNKRYVGQSIDIYSRWKDHKNKLNNNNHRNVYLQRAWNKYGDKNFQFYILKICPTSLLDETEISYINMFNCTNPQYGYNIESGGNANKVLAVETRVKMSEATKGKRCGGQNANARPVYCPQLDRTFECISDVEREGITRSALVRDCINGRRESAGQHPETGEALTWQRITKEVSVKEKKYCWCGAIYCIELDRVFPGGPSQAEREKIASRTCVSRCLKGERKSAGKHPVTGEKLHWKLIDNNT